MSNPLAAAAADVELTADGDIDFDALIEAASDPDPMIVRDGLLRIASLDQEAEQVKQLRAAIVDRYDARLATLAKQIADNRRGVEAYVIRFGKQSFPDAGAAYLTTKNKGGSIKCVDAVALVDHLQAAGLEVPTKPPVADTTAALELAIATWNIVSTANGLLANRQTGEVIEVPGVVFEPESKTLAVRKP